MRRPFFLIFTNAMILIVIFVLLTQSLVIVQRIAVADKLSGRVEVQRSGRGDFTALAVNAPIKTGDVIRSGADGTAEFKWLDGTRLKVTPNTQLSVKKAVHNMMKKADQTEFQLTAGKVFIRIMKALTPASKFAVETPTAVAAVRGTIFSVEVTGGKTKVAVFKGQVKVTSGAGASEQKQFIQSGQVAVSAQPGDLQTESAEVEATEFAQQPSIVKPQLQVAKIKVIEGGARARISGVTEARNQLTVNDEEVKVLGNGRFRKNVKLRPGTNTFIIVSTDKHGEKSTVAQTVTTPKSS